METFLPLLVSIQVENDIVSSVGLAKKNELQSSVLNVRLFDRFVDTDLLVKVNVDRHWHQVLLVVRDGNHFLVGDSLYVERPIRSLVQHIDQSLPVLLVILHLVQVPLRVVGSFVL